MRKPASAPAETAKEIIKLYELCEGNSHIRRVSVWQQYREITTYNEVSPAEYFATIRAYLKHKNILL